MGLTANIPARVPDPVLIAVFSTAAGLLFAIADFIHGGGDLAGFSNRMIAAWLWGLLFPLVLAADRRLPFPDNRVYWRVVAQILLSIPFAAAHTLLQIVVEIPFKIIWWNPWWSPSYAYFYFLGDWYAYLIIFSAVFAFRYYKRYTTSQLEMERLEKRLLQVHLDNLRMQLEPHFLSNALNAIASEVETNPPLARQIIADLGALLRLSHEYKDRHLIPLMEEISVLDHYLAIQRVRFGNNLKIEIRIAPEVNGALVPCLLIQPLVENAMRHGLVGARTGGVISISADRVGDRCEIRLTDDGVGLPPGWRLEASSGQGLTITRERLAALYPDGAARITVAPRAGGGTEVLLSIPLQPTVIPS